MERQWRGRVFAKQDKTGLNSSSHGAYKEFMQRTKLLVLGIALLCLPPGHRGDWAKSWHHTDSRYFSSDDDVSFTYCLHGAQESTSVQVLGN